MADGIGGTHSISTGHDRELHCTHKVRLLSWRELGTASCREQQKVTKKASEPVTYADETSDPPHENAAHFREDTGNPGGRPLQS